MDVPRAQPRPPRPSASVMLRRGDEILVCHRVSSVPAFPDYWAFPGGGVSRIDRDPLFALCREMIEEVGLTPQLTHVDTNLRAEILADKTAFVSAVDDGRITLPSEGFDIISERTTPPLAPLRFHNQFFTAKCEVEPILEVGERVEFDDYRWATPAQLLEEWLSHEIKIPPPIIMLLRDLIGNDLEEAIQILANNPPSNNRRIEFAPGVECVPIPTNTLPPATHTNCYVLGVPGGSRVIIDPAAKCAEGLRILEEKVNEIKQSGSEIMASIFTHRHPDHIGDMNAISAMYNAPIWATVETLEAIPYSDSTSVLKEGDSFQLEDVTWTIIETPGHCPGQLCLVSEAGIISGDNAVQVGTILVPSGEGDMTRYIEGLHRLRDLDPNLLFPGHGPMVANPTKLLTHYIEHRQKRHEAVFTAWQNGLREIEELSHAAYADKPDANQFLKIDQTMSHLDALRNEGRI
ncbi:MAG TPA: MBL fold metallo-hydrolase [Candidatus Thalassarchaeaceae archaeon]|nr:MBL fold metallo-hydrolase [Candidatus Thalassarchaeaceae archaeon]HJM67821.1 MBL fold metallo-hydrolase [Candidatus Thalassarchaeaceae archaeon]